MELEKVVKTEELSQALHSVPSWGWELYFCGLIFGTRMVYFWNNMEIEQFMMLEFSSMQKCREFSVISLGIDLLLDQNL